MQEMGDVQAMAYVSAFLFSPDAAAYVEREQPAWQEWLGGLAVSG